MGSSRPAPSPLEIRASHTGLWSQTCVPKPFQFFYLIKKVDGALFASFLIKRMISYLLSSDGRKLEEFSLKIKISIHFHQKNWKHHKTHINHLTTPKLLTKIKLNRIHKIKIELDLPSSPCLGEKPHLMNLSREEEPIEKKIFPLDDWIMVKW